MKKMKKVFVTFSIALVIYTVASPAMYAALATICRAIYPKNGGELIKGAIIALKNMDAKNLRLMMTIIVISAWMDFKRPLELILDIATGWMVMTVVWPMTSSIKLEALSGVLSKETLTLVANAIMCVYVHITSEVPSKKKNGKKFSLFGRKKAKNDEDDFDRFENER